jgi:hypothetical protein
LGICDVNLGVVATSINNKDEPCCFARSMYSPEHNQFNVLEVELGLRDLCVGG